MVREIKFRGVNAASRAVLEVDFVVDIDWMNDEVYFENGTDVATSIGSAKLMQYTGLKDKNGIEIYEKSQIDNRYYVDYLSCSYVLIEISTGDIIKLQDYYDGANGDVSVTREYQEI